ncbi:MAG: lysophospholipid acyltransferase family protein [Pseudomonadota bacterium]
MANSGRQPKLKYLETEKALGIPEGKSVNPMMIRAVEKLVGIDRCNKLLEDLGPDWPDTNSMVDIMFDRLDIKYQIKNAEVLEELDDRPKVFVANHPYGLPDAFALFQILTRYRPNIRLFANKILEATQLDDERLLYVDPFSAPQSRNLTRKSMAHALRHVREGGDLALFPGRICSHLKTSDWTISDSAWTDQVRKFVDAGGGDLVPLYITGRNSMLFNFSGLIHPRIRTYLLVREFLRGGHDFTFTIGDPVSADQLQKVSRSMSVGNFARSLVYSLKTGASTVPDLPHLIEPELRNAQETSRVVRTPTAIRGAHVRKLLDRNEILVKQNGYTIYQSGPKSGADILDIICEVRFQAYASETNVSDPSELRDHYDEFYHHLVLWDDEKEAVAGVYRYTLPGLTQRAPTAENLVTSSIFDLSPEFQKILPKAMELGRAAILPEYQKSFSPLMLLWRGFLEIPYRDKEIKYLFGPVTMGQNFNPLSRELLRRYIMNHCGDDVMKGHVSPRKALAFDIPREVEIEKLANACGSFAQLGNLINGIEGGKRSLPVLFRHYANSGCKFVGFGEWRELDNATAGLTLLDLKDSSKSFIQRYFGKEGAEEFYAGR